MLLALYNGTPEQIAEKTFTKQYTRQILCIAENIIEIHTSANPVFGTNIKGPESAVKGTLAEKKMRAVKVFDHMEDFHRAYIFMFRLICRNNCFIYSLPMFSRWMCICIAEIIIFIIFPMHRKKGYISCGRTNLQLRRGSIV